MQHSFGRNFVERLETLLSSHLRAPKNGERKTLLNNTVVQRQRIRDNTKDTTDGGTVDKHFLLTFLLMTIFARIEVKKVDTKKKKKKKNQQQQQQRLSVGNEGLISNLPAACVMNKYLDKVVHERHLTVFLDLMEGHSVHHRLNKPTVARGHHNSVPNIQSKKYYFN